MYVFISVLFFIALFLKKDKEEDVAAVACNTHYVNMARQQLADSLRAGNKPVAGATLYDSVKAAVVNDIAGRLDTLPVKDTTEAIGFAVGSNGVQFTLVENKYSTLEEYDSIQARLPGTARDKGLMRWMLRTNISLKSRYGSRSQVVVAENFEHSLPKIMFVLLPLFAWFIYILHSRKKYFYAQHAIFSVHFHSFMFFVLLFITIIRWIFPHLNDLYLLVPALIILFAYLVAALHKTYGQPVLMAVIKTMFIGLVYIISLVICIIALAFINFITA
jgi:hypothetical protein